MRGDEGKDFEGRARIDSVIDAALRSYAEPREAPEARMFLAQVMERARDDRERKFGWWLWGALAAACLAVAAGMGIWMLRAPRAAEIAWIPKAPTAATDAPQPLKADSPRADYGRAIAVPLHGESRNPRSLVGNSSVQHEQSPGSSPKLDVFPTPRPLTDQEQALVAFAEQATAEQQKHVVEAEQHLGDPIAIAELKIRPLNEGEKTDSDNER